jgi:hypothetical protein
MLAQAKMDQETAAQEGALRQQEFNQRMQEMQLQEQIASAQHIRDMEMLNAKAELDKRNAIIDGIASEHEAGLDHVAREHQHELTLDAASAKAAAAKSSAKNGQGG